MTVQEQCWQRSPPMPLTAKYVDDLTLVRFEQVVARASVTTAPLTHAPLSERRGPVL